MTRVDVNSVAGTDQILDIDDLHRKFGVTTEQLDTFAAEYESDDWSHMKFGAPKIGRPRIADEKLDTVVVKIPHSKAVEMGHVIRRRGETRSDFVRRAIERELAIGVQ
jgi:hypothetical protein